MSKIYIIKYMSIYIFTISNYIKYSVNYIKLYIKLLMDLSSYILSIEVIL